MPRAKPPKKLLTQKQVAELLSVSPMTVARYAKDKKIEHVKLDKGIRFTEAQVSDFIKRMTRKRSAK